MSERPIIRTIRDVPSADLYTSGHRTCAGCGAALGYRLLLKAAGPKTVILGPTGCMYVANGHQFLSSPYSVPWYHTQLGAGGAAGVGTAAAFRSLMMKGKRKKEKVNVVVYGGDGGTGDIGFSGLSMAMSYDYKRFLYVLYDNESYANTGIQASSTTPWGASTTFTPTGKVKRIGNLRMKKNVALIIAAHPGVRYVATSTLYPPLDFINKAKKALAADGPAFIHLLVPCPKGWFTDPKYTLDLSRSALETGLWVSWEYENGKFSLSFRPEPRKHVEEYLRMQKRFEHLTHGMIEEIERMTAKEWDYWKEMDRQKSMMIPWVAPP
ncbi:MAG: thiamine pyrophosphate-dependent enzyme [Candidatus Bathyarchaeia archaeon]